MSFLLLSIHFLFVFSSFVSPTRHHFCLPDQRDTLLEFKTQITLIHPHISCYPKTESWLNHTDCCSWKGITCDPNSGQVNSLDLHNSCLHGRLESNTSLFKLHHLRDLNLAYNNFTSSPIPHQFNRLKRLEGLNLAESSFSGEIPTTLLHLTKLISLNLSSFVSSMNPLSLTKSFLLTLTRNLRNLRYLDMSYVDFSSEIPLEFSTMWSLTSLRFEGCNVIGVFPSSVFLIPNLQSIILDFNMNLKGNLPAFLHNNSMQILSLSYTSFSGTIPDSIINLKHLISFKLSSTYFSGSIPSSLGNLSHLSYLDLFGNNFLGEIPSSFGNLKQLSYLDFSGNKLTGNFPTALLNLTELRSINLCSNQFTGSLPLNISLLSKLESFSACYNSFTGPIPSSLFKITSLTDIHLNDNQLSNPLSIQNVSSMLPKLRYLFIGNNNFRLGHVVDLSVLSPFKELRALDLSGIPLSTTNIIEFPTHLQALYLSSCNIITEFPEFIRNQRNLSYLDLSNNNIKGQLPDWLWRLPELYRVNLSSNSLTGFLKASPTTSKISELDISSNDFQGPLFFPSTSIVYLFASRNNFTGKIPGSICGLNFPSLLDLSNNNLNGSFPQCLETLMTFLTDLNLRNNSITGSLPNIFTKADNLRSLDVSHNRLNGKLPDSLINCSSLEVLNIGNNRINDTFPLWLNSLQNLKVLILTSNEFHGELLHPFESPHLRIVDVSHNNFTGDLKYDYFTSFKAMYSNGDDTELTYIRGVENYYDSLVLMSKGIEMEMIRVLTIYTAIDYSGNKIYGQIPESIGLLKGLHVLNLSSNGFSGHIPLSLGNLMKLESLDLSKNKLSGEIPPELGDMTSLEWINVSYNELVGSIPQGTQFQRQSCSSYEGNPGLDGSSLEDICGEIDATMSPPSMEDDGVEEEEWLSWRAVGIGFAMGVVFGMTMGYKREWFMKMFRRSSRH